MTTYSLAGTGAFYVEGRGRINDDRQLHVQFSGHGGNRSYGCAYTLSIDLALDLAEVNCILPSLAGTENRYFTIQARPRDGKVHFQVSHTEEGNRSYGFAFDVENMSLYEWLMQELGDEDDSDDVGEYMDDDSNEEWVDEDNQDEVSLLPLPSDQFGYSLAETGQIYMEGLGRLTEKGLRIQLKGPKGNRSWGYSLQFDRPQELQNHSIENGVHSYGDGNNKFFNLQVRSYGDNNLHVQIPWAEINRDYGAAFNVTVTDEVETWLEELFS